jgi:putative aminopeptidase FrvX
MATRFSPPKSSWATLQKTCEAVLSVPTASFHESWLKDFLEQRLSRLRGVRLRSDEFGNLHIRYRGQAGRKATLCFQAHMDHPGFVITGKAANGNLRCRAFGGIPQNILGEKLRFFTSPDDSGTLTHILSKPQKTAQKMTIEVAAKPGLEKGAVGMWNFPAFRRKGQWVEGRAFDDTLSVALLVFLLEKAAREKWRQSFDVLFTTAEEVAYVGSWHLLQRRQTALPQTIITLEVPRAYGELRSGDGVMLRAGDKNINFDPYLLLALESRAKHLSRTLPGFRAQRRLGLLGGTEVTLFQLHGYRAGALCVAVQNGHNADLSKNGRPAPERAHITDVLSLLHLVEDIARHGVPYEQSRRELTNTIAKRVRAWNSFL